MVLYLTLCSLRYFAILLNLFLIFVVALTLRVFFLGIVVLIKYQSDIYFFGRSILICNSLSCLGSASEGASMTEVWPEDVTGKGMTSRMLSSPAKIMTKRSSPGAMPA